MSSSFLEVGLLSAGVIFLIGGAALAFVAARIASAGKAAKAEADIRLAASQELAAEVKRLAEKVEMAMQSRDASIENAFLRHNDACAASMQASMAAKASHDHDEDDDDHKKHHANALYSGGHDDDDDHKKHHASSASGGGHHDDDDDDHQKHHAAAPRPSLLARLLGRAA